MQKNQAKMDSRHAAHLASKPELVKKIERRSSKSYARMFGMKILDIVSKLIVAAPDKQVLFVAVRSP